MRNAIALTSVAYNALQACLYAKQRRKVSQVKLPSEGYRPSGGGMQLLYRGIAL